MYCWHINYLLGDKNKYITKEDFKDSDEYKNAYLILPVYLYDHSIIAISNEAFIGRAQHAEWDSGQIGFIFADITKLRNLGIIADDENKTDIEEILRAETEIYNNYIQGNVYAYRIEANGDEVEQLGGFYGQDIIQMVDAMKTSCNEEYHPLFNKFHSHVKTLVNIMD